MRQLLVQAQRRGMCNGDYAFFAVDILKADMLQGIGEGSYGWQTNDIYDQEASTAFRVLFILSLRQSTKNTDFKDFEAQVRARVKTNSRTPPLEVNYYSRCFYDAVLVYAAAMQLAVDAGGTVTPDNAVAIGRLFNNNTYNLTSSSGLIFLDGNGDKLEDYQLLQMQAANSTKADDSGFDVYEPFFVVAEYYGYRGKYEAVRPVRWLSPDGKPVANRPECGFDGSDQKCVAEARRVLGAALGGAIAAIVIAVFVSLAVSKFLVWRVEVNNLDWVATWVDIYIHQRNSSVPSLNSAAHSAQQLGMSNGEKHPNMVVQAGVLQLTVPKHDRSAVSLQKSNRDSKGTVRTKVTNASMMKTSTIVATFRGTQVLVRPCMVEHVELTSGVRSEVRLIRTFVCENLVKFIAACVELEHVVVLGEYCSRGTLEDVLQNETVTLDWTFRLSFISDVVAGLMYLHNTVLQQHGRLTSKSCLIDKRFVLKLGDYGLSSFYNESLAKIQKQELLWTAPEHLRSTGQNGFLRGSQEGDAFSFAIVLQEIVLKESPYFMNDLNVEEIIRKVEKGERPPFRPTVTGANCPQEINFIMTSCWAESPAERLKFAQIRSYLRQLSKSSGHEKNNIIDMLIERMEQHALNLETSVEEKTQALVDEKKKTDQLLPIAEQLKRGESIPPELYDNVTIYFGDIVEFTTLSSASSPTDIVTLMNDLYIKFDEIILQFDAYKVETIGDCYVIVSGLPRRNGQHHAAEIAKLALTLRSAMSTFKVRHMPEKVLQLRIGLNSGPCVAGVVGIATPRYCLFGDTVNVASRMESTGEPMKIQMTQTTQSILAFLGGFHMELRGEVPVKGKGTLMTFWLLGTNQSDGDQSVGTTVQK
ncbi:Atrial natriuretic peptide receptor 2 [Hypsibius exemplaris]|uniref:Guanylate cyclase n=1 Tax=Hypsibius exemplaris TaxID=2072580 RepID=A0A1W0WR83_HYPEX|nr:Atrial natriuretic peptide receptor 2 [Hypsibius exemplaris]